MAKKSDYVITFKTNVVITEKWLVKNETKEDAIYIAENQNMSSKYDCTSLETEEDCEDAEFVSAKEVVFTKRTDFKGHKKDKYFWKEIE